MRQPHVDDHVRLTCDIPDLSLHRGQVGVVRSTWCEPLTGEVIRRLNRRLREIREAAHAPIEEAS